MKKVVIIATCLALLLSLVPIMAVPAAANDEPEQDEWTDITYLFPGADSGCRITGSADLYFSFDTPNPRCTINLPDTVGLTFAFSGDLDADKVPDAMQARLMEGALSGLRFSAPEGYSYVVTFECIEAPAYVIGRGEIGAVEEEPPTPPTTPAVPGDYNADGKITELDALAALRMAVGLLDEDLRMDVDGDGWVTGDDALLLLKQAVK